MNHEELLDDLEGIVWKAELNPFRYIYVSAGAAKILGHSVEDILSGKSGYINPVLRKCLDEGQSIDEAWCSSKPARELYEWFKPDGTSVLLKDNIKFVIATDGKPHLACMTVDVGDVNATTQALSKEHQIIFDNVPAMIWYKDTHNIILRANKWAAESMGLTVESVIGRSTYDLYPEDAQKYYEDDMSVVNSGISRHVRDRYITVTGEVLWLDSYKIPLRDENGETYGVIIFSQDITDKKHAEDRLIAAHADLEAKVEERTKELSEANIFFKLTRELFTIADFDGYFCHVNPMWTETLGYAPEELLAKPFIEFIHPDDHESTLIASQNLAKGIPVRFFENRYICKDGSIKWLIWNATADLETRKVYSVAHDITDRRKTEAELENVSDRIDNVAKHLPGVIYQFLRTANGAYSFPYISESCRAIFGHERHEIEKDANLAFYKLHPDDLKAMGPAIEHSFQTLTTFKFETRIIANNGSMKWIRATSSPESIGDGNTLWNGLMMDITDIKTAEDKIKQLNDDLAQRVSILAAVNQELEILTHKLELAYDEALEASKLKSEFVANISHEVRTPISAVLGMTELLMDTPLSGEQDSFVKIVNESAQSLLTIINDILDFSKMEAGRLELEVIDLNVRSLVEGCADWLASSARRKHLALMTYSDPSIPQFVKGDPVRLRQVLLNLATNAIKFTETGEIIVKATKFRETEERVVILFQVSDTGIGLSEAARKRLFQPFAQADGSTTRKYGGTGLGLSISKRLVEMMGGEIGVTSEEKKGSTFWFTVPLEREKWLAQPDLRAEQVQVLEPFDVLVIDHSTSSRNILCAYLESAGIRPHGAATPGDALHIISEMKDKGGRFTVTIVDASGDTFDGFTLAKQIVKLHPETSGRVILIGAYDEKERMEEAVKAGVTACLVKPLRRAHLLEVVLKPNFRGQEILSMPDDQDSDIETVLLHLSQSGSELTHTADGGANRLHVLLAEDNPVLQQLAERQLRKFGFDVLVVGNGKEAVNHIEQAAPGHFVAIFMDCQMPGMDGYEATAAIRALEASRKKRIPIIAMTAGAMPSDRERCIQSGMDDYLSKPVGHEQLKRVISAWVPQIFDRLKGDELSSPTKTPTQAELDETKEFVVGSSKEVVAEGAPDDEVPIKIEDLQKLYGKEDLEDILRMFLTESIELLGSIQTQIDAHQDRELAATAHQMKGLSAVLCANDLTRLSLEIEQSAKQSAWEPAAATLVLLTEEFEKVRTFVNRYLIKG